MPAPPQLHTLIDRFQRNLHAYRSGHYNETQVRRDFIDPLLKLLGWDIDNEKGYAEQYREVVHEDAVKVSGSTKAPDYSLRIGGQRKLFVEAKKPSVNIKQDLAPAFQVRRYAWSAKLPLSILTDFEEFAVYDCRDKPDKKDAASHARIMYFTFEQYAEKWDELVELFSPQAIMQGAFDKFVDSSKKKRGTAEVDDAFLAEISTWRDALARNIALRNPGIKTRQLNHAVQRTIDRLIFLRIAEDRGIEPYGRLREATTHANIYTELGRLFQLADAKYNSGLFHFKTERGWDEPPDTFTLGLTIDDKILRDIIKRLYYPDSPYQFDVIPADILGQVYEQFLGQVIRLTSKGQAKIEDKPEVKKAGGVFYTPTYIVDYIVQQTVGQLLQDKKPGPKGDASKLRILDPACGSGSFLLGAYQYLLDWHLTQYLATDPDKWARGKEPPLYQNDRGDWRLTIGERKRILLNNIYGVDIDPQAVEVTKLSLLLKVMEGENEQTLGTQLRLLPERVLPDLSANIQCGNSLIGPDFYDVQQLSFGIFDEEEMYRVNVFDWAKAFPRIVPWGGFDAVIGNPPYVRPHNIQAKDKNYFWRKYSTFVKKSDLYCCFVEKGVSLLKPDGKFGYIISNGWLRLDSFEALRKFILKNTSVQTIIDFTDNVFQRATVKTNILILSKLVTENPQITVSETRATPELDNLKKKKIPQKLFEHTYKSIFDLSINEFGEILKTKMRDQSIKLGETVELAFGLKTGDDSKFLMFSSDTVNHKPLLRGANIQRYSFKYEGEYVWYVPNKMREHRTSARPGTAQRFEQPKILIRDTGGDLYGTFDDQNYFVKDVLVLFDKSQNANKLKFLTGLLNSKLLKYFYETSFPTLHVQRDEISVLPIIDIKEKDGRYKNLVSLVESMLTLQQQLTTAQTAHEKTILQRQITATDRQIDQLVYQLYNLTPEEIAIVEGA